MENMPNKLYQVAYKLYTINASGEKKLQEEATVDQPFQFITGFGSVLDLFEQKMLALSSNDAFDFEIPCAEAYGAHDEEHVIPLERTIFEVNGRFDTDNIYPGAFVPLQNADGQRINSTIVSVDATTVVVDLNHPFAGCDLQFAGSIVEARTATADEITAMVKMLSGEGGCSCGCEGDCEGGCGGEEGAGCGDKGGCSCH